MKQALLIPTLENALSKLCSVKGTQAGEHIKPIHSYCGTRLVVEGGFPPEWVNPCPPFASRKETNFTFSLIHAPDQARSVERPILGGIKSKDVDVSVVVPNIGPALGVSAKSTGNAFRNLTNRMEEALGECTNVHLMYPGFVFGFLHLIKFARLSEVPKPDASFDKKGAPLDSIKRYHDVLVALSGRMAITDPAMRYEAVALLVYTCEGNNSDLWPEYPPKDSPVHFFPFFQKLYNLYDLRYSYPAPQGQNARKGWNVEGIDSHSQFDRSLKFPWGLRLAAD